MAKRITLHRKFGLYHILQRGNNKSYIFNDPLDKNAFFELIDDSQKRAREIYSEIIQEGVLPHTESIPIDELITPEALIRGETVEEAIERFLEGDKSAIRLLMAQDRSPKRSSLRRECAIYVHSLGFSAEDIAKFYGTTGRAVRYLVEK